ncbi:hypothetical protein C0Q70_14154 [Pomacea canaliculata]|uniref:Protein STPG4 n=1 Tax=Pomacea canaliculata TaxID=400727 RepID=A0A2T7NZ74_POMCA|nr:hypothetical protein C0Q70_14154 [Pomacea canaliculata]
MLLYNRKALSEDYELPISGREGWWRSYIRETPRPGSYDSSTFVDDISQRPNTYRFKSDGRKIDPQPHNKGSLLLPGAYDFQSFLDILDKKPIPATYNFRTPARDSFDVLNFGKKDKEINVSPTAYQMDKYLSLSADKMPSKHPAFKSQVKRFPTLYFKPKEGPGPGLYDSQLPVFQHPVSSSFKSRTPRFSTSYTKVPGPGTYEKIFQFPIPPTVAKMGRQYGLFFTSAFQS